MKKGRVVLLSFIIFLLLSMYIPRVYGGPAVKLKVEVPLSAKVGVPFNITIKALDASDVLDSSFSGTVNLSVVQSGFAIYPYEVIFNGSEGGQKIVSVTISSNDLTNWATIQIKATKTGLTDGISSGFSITGGNPSFIEVLPLSISGSTYSVFSVVATNDADDGLTLIPFNANEKGWDQDASGTFTEIDYYYIDIDGSNNVSSGDVRITPVTWGSVTYPAGSIVKSGDTDLGAILTILFGSNLKHLENVKVDGKYNYGELLYLDSNTNNTVDSGDIRRSTTPGFYTTTAGNPITYEVRIYDEWKNIVCDYNKNVVFNSSDPLATFSPSNYTFNFSDNGKHTFTNGVILKTSGTQTINALDGSGLQDLMPPKINVGVSTLHHFEFYNFSTTTPVAGTSFSFRVKAVDEFGNTVTNYTGTVHFSTTDTYSSPPLILPPDTTYVPADNGDRPFNATLITAGPQTIYVEDTSNPTIKGSATFNVQPQILDNCTFVFESIGPQTVGNSFQITIKVKDSFGNLNTSFNGVAYLASSPVGISPTSITFTNGVWTGNVILTTSSSAAYIYCDDETPPTLPPAPADPNINPGISNTFTVSDPDPISFQFEPIGNQSKNTPFQITVKAVDSAGRIVTSYNGPIKLFVSTPGGTITPNIINLTNGIWTGNVTLSTSDSGAKIYANSQYGEYIYYDIDNSNSVNVGDKRLTNVRNYNYNTFVASGNTDIGLLLITFASNEKHTENVSVNNLFDFGEYIYVDIDGDNKVSVGDKRLTPYGNYRANTYVQSGDSDLNINLITFNSLEKHTEHIISNSTYDIIFGESNIFSVSSSVVDHFEFLPIASPQTAGVPFSVTIYAKDSFGMIVTSFNQQVIISSLPTMGVSTNPSPVVFVNGIWSGTVTLNTPSTAVKLVATYGSVTGESNLFALQGTLNHFSFSLIPSPQKVNQSFFVEITARDGNENIVTNFTGNVNLTLNPSGPISPGTVGPFVNGKWSGYITINSPFSSVQIVATDAGGSGMNGYSNSFSVVGPLDHFHFSPIAPQVSGVPFLIRIEAHDSQHNLISDLNTTLTLSSSVGNIIPTSVNMVNGVFEGNITLDTPTPSVFITASALSKFGTSNNFSVSAGLHHFTFDLIASPQTAGTPFLVKIYAKDSLDNIISNFNATVPISATVPANFVIEPTSVNFVNGVWSGYITLYKTGTNVQLKVEYASKYGLSNQFNVLPGPLHHFKVTSNDLDPVTGDYKPVGPQTVGCVFNPGAHPENALRITAVDQWDNTVTTYSGAGYSVIVTSTDPNAQIAGFPLPYTLTGFSSGVRVVNSMEMGTVGIHTITVTDTSNPGIKGTSNPFTVASQTIHHFDFDIIGPQTINNPFNITIYAKDINGYIVSAWDNTDTWGIYGGGACNVNLTASTGGISPITTGNFTLGKWTGNVTLDTPHPSMKITANNGPITGTSNSFTCASNVLGRFEFELISNQTAGIPFNITIKAVDLAGSLITTWNGTALLTSSTGPGTISPSSTTSFINGRWTGSVTINTPNPSVQIFAEDPITHKMGMSNIFSVFGALDHFTFDTIPSPQVAGTSFTIKIYAKDSLNYTIPNFVSQVNLSVSDGTITPQITGFFNNGVWIGSVTLTKAGTNIKLIAEKDGKIGESNAITLLPAPVNNFVFSTIGAQTVNVPFSVTIKAYDEFGNLCTNFNGSATLSAVNSIVLEPTSITFINGVWTGNVKLGTHGTDVQLKVILTTPSVTSLSNKFTVAKGLHHFLISTIGNQNKGIPFEITVTAKDEDNSTVSSFNGTVNLTCSLGVGTIEPITLGPFVNGTYTGNIKINKAGDNVTITVTDPVSGKTGTSNAFKVFGDKIIFKSSPQTIDLEQKSSAIVISLVDPQGNPLIAPTNITVNLTTNSPTGKFSEDGVNWGITSIIFTSGSSEKSFYYKDSTPGAWDITVSATNYESATQRIVVSGKIANGSGQVSINPLSGLTNEKINITFTFTATFSLSGGAIKLTMPVGFPNPQLTDPNGDCFVSVTPDTGVSLGTIQTQLNNLIINIQTMASGNKLTIKLNNVTLPSIEGNYTFSFFTMGQGGTFTPIANQPQFRVDKGFSLEILSLTVSPQTASTNAGYTIIIRVGTKGELSVSDEINIKFPIGTFIPATINTNLIKLNDTQITTSPIVNQSANTITIKTPIPLPKETTAKIEISPQAGIINPPQAGNYTIEVTTNKETKPATYNFVLSPAPPISDIEVNVKPQSAGKEAEYNILFRININLLEGDKIYIKFPLGTNIPQSILPTAIQVSGVPIRYEPLVIGRLLVLTLSAPIVKGENSIIISKSAKIKNPEIPDKYILYLYTSRDLNEVPSKPYEIVGTPYTIITVTPELPDGINGWYVTKPKIKLEGKGEGVIETYYYWDDEEPQLYTQEFYAKEGEHILYFYSKTKGLDNAEQVRSRTFKVDTTPPKITILEPKFEYTNRQDLVISGITEPTILVSAQTSRTTSNTKGQFNLLIKLVPGLNTIKVQAIDSAGNISEVTLSITLDTTPPYLELDPSITKWMEVFTETFEVKGKVEVGAKLSINGIEVSYDLQGNFSYSVRLQEGNNSISIVAVDRAGNENSIYLPIKYIKRTVLKIKIGSKTVYVNDKPVQIEAAPWIDKKSGRAMVPLRVIVEAFGATVEYRYISFGDERVSIIFKLKRIDLRIGSNIAYVEGLPVRLDAPPVIINGRTFVPIRFIMETFGAKVDWDPFSSEITITYPAP